MTPPLHLPVNRLALLDELPKHSIGAELGVFEGAFSAEIIRRVQPETLFLVDLFAGNIISGDQDGRNLHSADMARMFQRLRTQYADQPSIHVVCAEAVSWLRSRKAATLDWVYLDTTHTFQQTAFELAAALRAVKPGGIISGHDYHPEHYAGLVRAVNEFCESLGTVPEIFAGDGLPSYLIRRPRSNGATE